MRPVARPRTRDQRAASRRGHRSRLGSTLAIPAVVIAAVFCVVTFVVPRLTGGAGEVAGLANEGSQVQVTIPDGSGANAIAAKLKEAGLITDTSEFVRELQRQRADSSLKSGSYVFTVGQSTDEIIQRLKQGPNNTQGQLTIPEGLTVTQTAAAVQSGLGISQDEFLNQAKASNYAGDYAFLAGAQNDSLEGFLCPKTYDFSSQQNVTADTVIRAMLDQYAKDVASLDFSGAEATIKERYGLEMSDYQILTLASVVEREAVTQAQRPKVSSTFYNRLKQGMALQSDATMMYVTGGQVSASDLKTESPYNTYLNTGLTPTPICSPSIESIKATLAPDNTDYLYFYITQTDEWFSSTYDDHLKAIEADKTAQTQG